MKKLTLSLLGVSAVFGYLVSCSPVSFTHIADPSVAGPGITTTTCQGAACKQHHTDTQVAGKGQVDILVVLDTSASMSDVQASMASRFNGFLDSISQLDYQIGVITMDVSSNVSDTKNNLPRAGIANNNGATMDGKLLTFATSGSNILTPTLANQSTLTSWFNTTIKRDETRQCENSAYDASYCPSQETRGVFATSLALAANPAGFFRSQVPLTVIMVSDSDERASGGTNPNYPLGTQDQPSNLINQFQSLFPTKTLVVDGIVIEPGDSTCYNQRKNRNGNPLIFGFYGNVYASLVKQTGGVLGSVCAPDYTSQLGQIGASIQNQVNNMTLACAPINQQYTVTYSPDAPGVQATANWNNNTISFSPTVPPGTTVTISYDCAVSH